MSNPICAWFGHNGRDQYDEYAPQMTLQTLNGNPEN